jgi:hypothetical protein
VCEPIYFICILIYVTINTTAYTTISMDLLLDDKSSSSEEDSDDDNDDNDLGDDTIQRRQQQQPQPQPTQVPPSLKTTTSTSTNSNTDTVATKGKRLLSLASVLPPHILAALTKQQQTHRNRDSDDDDEDEYNNDDDNEYNTPDTNLGMLSSNNDETNDIIHDSNHHPPTKRTNSVHTSRRTSSSHANNSSSSSNININRNKNTSDAISSFLKDLHQVGFTNNSSSNTSTNSTNKNDPGIRVSSPTTNSAGNHHPIQDDQWKRLQPPPPPVQVSKLGEAFMQSTTTTLPSKSIMVRNIHDHEDNNNNSNEALADQNDNQQPSRWKRPNITIRAAPPVFHAAPSLPLQQQPPLQQQQQQQQAQQTPPSLTEPHEQRFLSRKEIERTLRRGGNNKMDDVWKNMDFTQTQDGVDPIRYAPNVIAAAQQQQLTSISSNASFIKNSTTHIYDPALGMTVPYNAAVKADSHESSAATKTVAMKGRGKNQINALLSQAVTLERERNEQQLPSATTSKTTQQIHRANAKRKYGW